MTVNEAFASVLKDIRMSRNVSKAELGRRIGISRQGVSDLERLAYHIKLETAFKIAKALDMRVEVLVKLVDMRRFERED